MNKNNLCVVITTALTAAVFINVPLSVQAANEQAAAVSGKHTLEEHQLSSEVIYLINALKARPNKETLAQLEERIKSLFEDYGTDLKDFLNIEVDIGIEEARKLHRIDHYITFLEMLNGSRDIDEEFKAENNTYIGHLKKRP